MKCLETQCDFPYATAVHEQTQKSVLVVDDDVAVLRLLRESLTALLHLDVDTTPSPEYAFELALKKKYDLLVVDFSMPGIDGAILHSLIAKVYSITPPPWGKMPPTLLMSGHASQKRAQELLTEPGVRGLIAKPFTIERLVEKVSEVLRS
jgi:CheY-like chemotaxis protein